MTYRVGSKQERRQILLLLTDHLVDSNCTDLEILKQVDRLCRRTWSDINRGWIRWSYYLEKLLGVKEYNDWARQNCNRLKAPEVPD